MEWAGKIGQVAEDPSAQSEHCLEEWQWELGWVAAFAHPTMKQHIEQDIAMDGETGVFRLPGGTNSMQDQRSSAVVMHPISI